VQDDELNTDPLLDDEYDSEESFDDLFCTSYTIPPAPPCQQ
jgi:hypothetical protein